MAVWQRNSDGDVLPRRGQTGFAVAAQAIARSWCAAAAAALVAMAALAIWSPRLVHGEEPTPAVAVSQPGSRALRSIDPMPHDDLPEIGRAHV